jgi:glucose/mannose transport system permease protein
VSLEENRLQSLSVKRIKFSRIVIYGLLVLFAVFYLLPLYILFVTSVKPFNEISLAQMWSLPKAISLSNFRDAWLGNPAKGFGGLGKLFLNSVYVAVPATLLSTVLGSLNAYVLTKWRFRGSDLVFSLFLFGMFIPYQSILIPLVETMRHLHLYGTLASLVVAQVVYGLPITTLIFRNYYATVPHELLESARIDGAGFGKAYTHIFLPLSLPASAVVIIWQFTQIWNSYLFPVILAQSPKVQTITVGLVNIAGSYFVEWSIQMAGAVLTALPTLLVFVFLGRYFLRGMMAGAVKG